ncbi:hypothetical protein F4679DRAFT_583899 [Xylaria curta]|nr:hypothetical protein F4679DRAFT_583899 [Xylaria curta]
MKTPLVAAFTKNLTRNTPTLGAEDVPIPFERISHSPPIHGTHHKTLEVGLQNSKAGDANDCSSPFPDRLDGETFHEFGSQNEFHSETMRASDGEAEGRRWVNPHDAGRHGRNSQIGIDIGNSHVSCSIKTPKRHLEKDDNRRRKVYKVFSMKHYEKTTVYREMRLRYYGHGCWVHDDGGGERWHSNTGPRLFLLSILVRFQFSRENGSAL